MRHIVIANQHGENRGDEAAMRAMLERIEAELGEPVRFTLLYQFQDRSLRLEFKQQVEDLPIALPPKEYLRAGLFTAGNLSGMDLRAALPNELRRIVEAYETADMVISAPGGPYFGDIYANHEIVHWWYVWLAWRMKKPLFLYAPSAGPFENVWLNPVRKLMYPKFDVLVSREELSANHIKGLLGRHTRVHVTADSAIQLSFEPLPREEYFADREELRGKFLVAVSLNDYGYPGAADPKPLKARYEAAMLQLLRHLHLQRDCHFLLLPQLYGAVHSDVPFLEKMASRLPKETSWEIVSPSFDSDMQRKLFAMCDLHLASRYHPAIFGHTGYVPGICIYYEHKAQGFMSQLGRERFAFDIRKPDGDDLCKAADELLATREQAIADLRQSVPKLQKRARRTTELAVELLRHSRAQATG